MTLLGLVYKLAMCAEGWFRQLDGFTLLAEVIVRVKFKDGIRESVVRESSNELERIAGCSPSPYTKFDASRVLARLASVDAVKLALFAEHPFRRIKGFDWLPESRAE